MKKTGLAALIVCALLFTAQAEHTHIYVQTKEQQPTCTENGYAEMTCECGDSYTVVAEAKGHTWEGETVEPTCSAEGYTLYTCVNCGESYTDDFTLPTGHCYVNGICANCGEKDPLYIGTENSFVRVPSGTMVYSDTSLKDPIGMFTAESIIRADRVSDCPTILQTDYGYILSAVARASDTANETAHYEPIK